MSLVSAGLQIVRFPLYYKEIISNGIIKVIIVDDKKAKEIMEKENALPEKDKTIKVLNTGWKILNWDDHNVITTASTKDTPDGLQRVDFFRFRRLRVENCLCEWDLKDDTGNPVPVTTVGRLPSDVIVALVNKYDKLTGISEDEEEKN